MAKNRARLATKRTPLDFFTAPLENSNRGLTFSRTACYNEQGFYNASVAELADALDLGSSGQPCRFDSCHSHQGVFERALFFHESDRMRRCTCFLLDKKHRSSGNDTPSQSEIPVTRTRKRLRIGYNSESFSTKSAFSVINPLSWMKSLCDAICPTAD